MTVERAEPPRTTRETVYPWDDLAKTCRGEPNTWFRMEIGNRVYANFAKNGRYTAFADDLDKWEFTTRKDKDDGKTYIHARYRTR